MESFRGGLARQDGNGVLVLRARHIIIDQLGPRGFQLGLRLSHVRARRHTTIKPVLRELEVILIGLHGGFEQFFFAIRAAQLKVILRKFRLIRQPRVLQLGVTDLRGLRARPNTAPDTSPNIGFLRHIHRQVVGGA